MDFTPRELTCVRFVLRAPVPTSWEARFTLPFSADLTFDWHRGCVLPCARLALGPTFCLSPELWAWHRCVEASFLWVHLHVSW